MFDANAEATMRRLRPGAVLNEKLEALPIPGRRIVRTSEDVVNASECAHRMRSQNRVCVRRALEEGTEPTRPFDGIANDPVRLQPGCKVKTTRRIGDRSPLQHGAHIVDLWCDRIEVPALWPFDDRTRARPVGERDQLVGLPPPECRFLAGGGQALARELADRLEHPETIRPVGLRSTAQQALVEQRADGLHLGVADPFGIRERGAAAEDRQSREQQLFVCHE